LCSKSGPAIRGAGFCILHNDSSFRIGVETIIFSQFELGRNDAIESTSRMKISERVDLLLYTNYDESVMHYELQGCATDVVPITSDALAKNPEYIQDGMVAEILWRGRPF
jgi:hypothetical protein